MELGKDIWESIGVDFVGNVDGTFMVLFNGWSRIKNKKGRPLVCLGLVALVSKKPRRPMSSASGIFPSVFNFVLNPAPEIRRHERCS